MVRPTEGLGAVKNFGADDPGGFYAEGMAPRVDFVSQDPMNYLRPPKATSARGANHPVSKFTPDSNSAQPPLRVKGEYKIYNFGPLRD